MRGHVRKRGKTWGYWLDVGRDPATGRRRQRTKSGFATKRAAERALDDVIRSLDRGEYVERDSITIEEWIERWLATMESKIRPATLREYRQELARVVDRFGKTQLQALRPLDIEELYAALLKDGHRYGGGLSPKTIRNLHAALRRSLADAQRFGLVPRNVAALVRPPSVTHKELRTWTAEEVGQFLESVADDRLRTAYRLLVATGMRRGEVLGLRWTAVDLKAKRLQVTQTLTVVENQLIWSAPKTARSRRSVSIDNDTAAELKAHKRRQSEERLAAGDAWVDHGLVFCNELGYPLHPDRFTRRFQAAARRAGVPAIRLHDLRHTWATLALQAGIHPKVVSDRLGHATTGITLDIYSHVHPELDANAASVVADLFASPSSG